MSEIPPPSRPTRAERVAGREGGAPAGASTSTRTLGAAHRPDPVVVLRAQERTRVPELVPVRHERMAVSPFTFFRGAAAVFAADLGATPDSEWCDRPALWRCAPEQLRDLHLPQSTHRSST